MKMIEKRQKKNFLWFLYSSFKKKRKLPLFFFRTFPAISMGTVYCNRKKMWWMKKSKWNKILFRREFRVSLTAASLFYHNCCCCRIVWVKIVICDNDYHPFECKIVFNTFFACFHGGLNEVVEEEWKTLENSNLNLFTSFHEKFTVIWSGFYLHNFFLAQPTSATTYSFLNYI